MTLQIKRALCGFVIAIGILNFLAYVTIATRLGGDAINGMSRNGHYFFSSHGKQTEVSEAVFNYSRIHTYSVWITHPLAMVCGYLLSKLTREDRSKKIRMPTASSLD